MVEPFDVAPGSFEAFANRVIDGSVGYNDVPALAERWNDTGYGGEGLSIYDARLGAKVSGNVSFGLDVDILRAVELWRPARPDAISAESLYSFFLDLLVRVEVVEIIRG